MVQICPEKRVQLRSPINPVENAQEGGPGSWFKFARAFEYHPTRIWGLNRFDVKMVNDSCTKNFLVNDIEEVTLTKEKKANYKKQQQPIARRECLNNVSVSIVHHLAHTILQTLALH